MDKYTVTLSHNEVYFLTNLIGHTASSKYRSIINNDMDAGEDVRAKMIALVTKDAGKLVDDIYKELIKCDIHDIIVVTTKYRIIYKTKCGQYGISTNYYRSPKEFECDNLDIIGVDIIADTAQEFYE